MGPAIRRTSVFVLTLVALLPSSVRAHTGEPLAPHDLWRAWSAPPVVLLSLIFGVCCYALGARGLWRRAGIGRGITQWRAAAFGTGVIVLLVALVSPLDALGGALFSAHMVQHMLLVVVAAPLVVVGSPAYVMLFALPARGRRRVSSIWRRAGTLHRAWHGVSTPIVAWSIHVLALWLWHVPTFYDAALRDERIHVAEHVTFLVTALLFWWVALDRHRLRVGGATLYLFTAALQCTLLGALIAVARHPWYYGHLASAATWGLTPLEDQQLAGMIMWIPAGLAYLVALVPRLIGTLRVSQGALAGARPASAH